MNVLVTGGSRGIGRGVVLGALRAGHDVGFCYVNHREAAEETLALAADLAPERTCLAYEADVRDSAAVEAAVDRFADEIGDVEVAVCNAGINRDALCLNMSDEDWHEVIQTNLSGSFYVARAVLPGMLAGRFGRLIFFSSVARRGAVGQVNYAASKAGLEGLAGALCREYGPKGITANTVVLGFFDTDMTRCTMPERTKEWWLTFCPARRFGELDEVARAVLFLASREAGFINGQTLPVTGGLDFAG